MDAPDGLVGEGWVSDRVPPLRNGDVLTKADFAWDDGAVRKLSR
jgi:hypothetical protein